MAGNEQRPEGQGPGRDTDPLPPSRPPVAEAAFLRRRFLAYLLDASLLVPIGVLTGIRIWTLLGIGSGERIDPEGTGAGTVFLVGCLASLAVVGYNRWWRQGITGQSWGKRTLRLELVGAVDGRPIGPRAAFVRDVFNTLVAVGPAMALVHPNGLTLGDIAVGAVVRTIDAEDALTKPQPGT